MSLFQNTVVKLYAPSYQQEIDKAYTIYKKYFFDKEIQENIRQSKEEQFQEGFLRELFVKVLGYTLNPMPNYNLITEQKNITDAKKADGAILVDKEVVGVIELKDHKTVDLKKIEDQAFKYRRSHRNARYIITSNFEKLRFYIDNAVDFEEFNLFELNEERFSLLWLCLSYKCVEKGLPLQMKNESLSKEDKITKQLYKDYSEFKRQLFANLEALNPQYDRLTLFKKSQKLLDRLLFILFAEDSGLLPANSIVDIVEKWKKLRELDEYRPLYDRLKKFFGYMNTGHKDKTHEIFAYNGGLFAPDEVLDNVLIDDLVLEQNLLKIANFDFASDVDVNILGHIFENSLTEIEEVANAIENNTEVAQTSKRKKDGVFYTPRYITDYIVENTLGKLCVDKKQELGLDQLEYFDDAQKKRLTDAQKKRAKDFDDKIETYREWLKALTICDPACGSGAFLNAALNFLIGEHRLVDEMESKVFRIPLVFNEVENSILENNLYGVDINEESIEIAKLSLWLRTAKPHRKLNSLSNNIKCGNSLIDDPEVAGNKAFSWEKEFPQVFARGGFDVVIGNPPYVLSQPSNTSQIVLDHFKKYEVASYKIDLYHLFFERGISILKPDRFLSFITPNTYLTNTYLDKLRFYILKNTSIINLTKNASNVFADAGVDVCTITLSKTVSKPEVLIYNMNQSGILTYENKILKQDWLNNISYTFNTNKEFRITSNKIILLDSIASITFGLQTKDKKTYVKDYKVTDDWEYCYTGRDISRYYLNSPSLYFLNMPKLVKAGGSWNMAIHHSKKIVVRQVGAPEPMIAYDNFKYATLNTMYSIVVKDKKFAEMYVLSIINSKMIKYWWLSKFSDNKDLFPKIKGEQLKQLPIKEISLTDQQPFIEKADAMLSLNAELYDKRQRFVKRLTDNFEGIKITGALERFDEGDFKQLLAELKKQKITLSLIQQDEWEDYFAQYKTACNQLADTIASTDRQIDEMVYALYGLTDEEIAIVEGQSN